MSARDVLSFPRHGANYKPVLERVSNKLKKKKKNRKDIAGSKFANYCCD